MFLRCSDMSRGSDVRQKQTIWQVQQLWDRYTLQCSIMKVFIDGHTRRNKHWLAMFTL